MAQENINNNVKHSVFVLGIHQVEIVN